MGLKEKEEGEGRENEINKEERKKEKRRGKERVEEKINWNR